MNTVYALEGHETVCFPNSGKSTGCHFTPTDILFVVSPILRKRSHIHVMGVLVAIFGEQADMSLRRIVDAAQALPAQHGGAAMDAGIVVEIGLHRADDPRRHRD